MNQGRSGFLRSIPPVTLNIIIINAICWFAEIAFRNIGIDLTDYLGLHFFKSEYFYPHQIITYMFMHDPSSIGHLFFNMFAVFMFGRTLETVWGAKRFFIYYMLTGIGAGLFNMLVIYLRVHAVEVDLPAEAVADVYMNGVSLLEKGLNYSNADLGHLNVLINTGMIGASGAVFGVLVAFGMLFPNVELIMIPIPIPIKAKYFVIGYGAIELLLGLFNGSGDNVAHFAHLGGLIVGFIILLYWKKTGKIHGNYY